jgi:hypothetical protein
LPVSLRVGAVLLLALGGSAVAAEREHGAHVHGIGQLNLVVEGSLVEIELISPGANIVGFEHAPESPEDRAAVGEAVAILEDGARLFSFPDAAGCRLEEAEIESGLIEGHHAEHEGGEHAEQGDEEHGEHEDKAHAEFHAHYRFDCENADALTHLDLELFQRFPATRELEYQAVLPGGQSAGELTAESARLTF